jgi:ArsR family transcriptional regulator, lead/cadmium/zinc/bismuth-responsive transcriptional repressor
VSGIAPRSKLPGCVPADHAPRSARTLLEDDAALARAASLFRAVADVSRLKLLARLARGEWCVTELAEAAGLPMSTVSQQLRMLRTENLVRRRRVAKHIFYALADDHVTGLIRSALEHSQPHGPDDAAEQPARESGEASTRSAAQHTNRLRPRPRRGR